LETQDEKAQAGIGRVVVFAAALDAEELLFHVPMIGGAGANWVAVCGAVWRYGRVGAESAAPVAVLTVTRTDYPTRRNTERSKWRREHPTSGYWKRAATTTMSSRKLSRLNLLARSIIAWTIASAGASANSSMMSMKPWIPKKDPSGAVPR